MRRRLRWLLLAGPVAALPLFAMPFIAVAEVPSSIDHYAASAKAGAVHVYGYDNTEQFATVDSSFPLAFSTQAGQSGLGYSDATASYYDYGPVGVTLLGVPDGQGVDVGLGPQTVPPAHASYPGGRQQSTLYPTQSQFGAPGPPPRNGPYATAAADELSSKAFSTYVGSLGVGLQGLTSQTSSVLGSDGAVTTTAQAFVAQAVIGPFTFDKVDVLASVSSSGGTGRVLQSSSTIGSVTAAGQEVSLTDRGLTIGPQTVPVASNGATTLGTVTYTASLVAPEQKLTGSEASLSVVGVKVTAVEALPTGDIISEEYELGNATVDASVSPLPESGTGLSLSIPGGSLGSIEGTGNLNAGNFPSTMQGPPPTAAKAPPPPRLMLVAGSRKPLAVAFLGWEALVMCGVAAWVWARKAVPA